MSRKNDFIEFMINSGVLTFGDFITKSGRKTPYFINTGNYRTGQQIATLGKFYAQLIMEKIEEGIISQDLAAIFGPAYKGIPLAVATSLCLATEFNKEISYCFNRKEMKDHGEGGSMVGYKLQDKDSIVIVEDVITAGTAIRECYPILKAAADVKIEGLIISVDRMEKGQGNRTAVQEIEEDLGIKTFPLVTVKDILNYILEKQGQGHLILSDEIQQRLEEYFERYCY